MKIYHVTPQEYQLLFLNQTAYYHPIYHQTAFTELNRVKCTDDDVRYLIFSDTAFRGSAVIGLHGDTFHTPFSAPFGGFSLMRRQRVDVLEKMWLLLLDYCHEQGKKLRVTLPPPVYCEDYVAKSVNILSRLRRDTVPTVELSYHIDLAAASARTRAYMNQVRQSHKAGLEFHRLSPTPHNITEVYDTVKENHICHGYPMHRSLADVISTEAIVHGDYFKVDLQGKTAAAAIVYEVAPGIMQAVYWGDIAEYRHLRPMNMLSASIADTYRHAGKRILDLGPSTVDGIPNIGLCGFKDSMGASASIKLTYTFD